jgi:nitroreductase
MEPANVPNSKSGVGPAIHPILASRWSPRTFSERPVELAKLVRLFEAARWAPSSFNEQPWSFIVATREDAEAHRRLLSTLIEFNQQWAKQAPVLILTVAKLNFDHNGKPNRHAFYDVGQAVADLSVEATSLGLYVHQMAGFDANLARERFAIPAGFEAATAVAVGYLEETPGTQEGRTRKPLSDFVFSGNWGQAAPQIREAASGSASHTGTD